ncbi:MAG TPA: hypothetical protein VFL91_00085 [Thermomicrobiales bacterium]|nr:hypothetical protein [Thermomicrobiales bacterium]
MAEYEEPQERLSDEAAEVTQRNIEKSRELIEAKQERDRERERPPFTDPRHGDDSVPPGQDDVPRGGSSGGEIALGGGYKSSRRPG